MITKDDEAKAYRGIMEGYEEDYDDILAKMDEQIGHLGESLGKLFWDLHYAYIADETTWNTKAGPLRELVAVWLSLPFTREIMAETYNDYEKHIEEE